MFDHALLWRATDFWREGLNTDVRRDVKLYNTWLDAQTRTLTTSSPHYAKIEQTQRLPVQSLPAEFFQDVAGWFWSVKEDGYLVTLSRGGDGAWSMHTRSGTRLTPPRGFLDGLEKSTSLPPVMVGELVTSFTGCDAADRGDAGRRNLLRNEQFATIHRVIFGGADPLAWVGLRVKVFAFPNSEMHVRATYEDVLKVMAETLHDHPHIGMCRAGELQSTQHALDIFARVVQLGLEGIVIVNPYVKYGKKTTLDRHDDDVGTFFKLKHKIVLPGRRFQKTGRTKDVWKDGERQTEHAFTTKIDDQVVHFTDRIGKETGYARIKYMEHAPGMGNSFPCQSGYRHMHFAQRDDMSVMVPAVRAFTTDYNTRNILGVDPTVGRILSWDRAADRQKLERASVYQRLYNPRPFAVHDMPEEPEQPPPKRREVLTLDALGRTSYAKDYDPRTHPGPAGGTAALRQTRMLLDLF